MKIEICENCGEKIGLLEKACIYKGRVVCPLCDDKLRKSEGQQIEMGIKPNNKIESGVSYARALGRYTRKKKILGIILLIGVSIAAVILSIICFPRILPHISDKILDKILLIVMVALCIVALLCPPIRKSIGLLLVILGAILCLSCIGLAIGIPFVLIGGFLLFVGKVKL